MRKTTTVQLAKLVDEVGLADVLFALKQVCANKAAEAGSLGTSEVNLWLSQAESIAYIIDESMEKAK